MRPRERGSVVEMPVTSTTTDGGVRRILVATDLTAHGDRALARAIVVAERRGAALSVLHVIHAAASRHQSEPARTRAWPSWTRPADMDELHARRVRQELESELRARMPAAAVRIEHGNPGPIIEAIAKEEQPDLVVIGTSGVRPSIREPLMVGRTGRHLLRRLAAPLLIVRNRVRSTYDHVLVATDFSDVSGFALQAALRFFPAQTLHLLHAFEPAYANFADDRKRHEDAFAAAAANELDEFLTSLYLPAERRRDIQPVIERGPPAALIRMYVHDFAADLVVLGTRGRGHVAEALLGSTAKTILAELPCDALLVRGPRALAPRDR
jgi:nucleotide-binding universal stress UspA family protein